MKKILIVDDEAQILKALSRTFLETDYELITEENSMNVLTLLESAEIDMVISDMRMPQLDGYKLLSMIKEKHPKIIRVILSGYADEKPMFQALLHNIANLYVFKPWINDEFTQNINNLFAINDELKAKDLLFTIENLNYTLLLQSCQEKLISLIEAENLDGLITEIEQDPKLSKLFIQIAKSTIYGVMPNTVKQAAIYIGLHNLKSFIRFLCTVCTLKLNISSSEEAELLCTHSFYTSRIFLFLFEAFLHKQPPEAAMFAGLLHNIGLMILSSSFKDKDNLSSFTIDDYFNLEHGEYELPHQQICAYYLEQWELPFPIYEAALYHHRPLNSNVIHHELVYCVHIAQTYAWKALGISDIEPVAPEIFERIGTTSTEFEKRLARYLKTQ